MGPVEEPGQGQNTGEGAELSRTDWPVAAGRDLDTPAFEEAVPDKGPVQQQEPQPERCLLREAALEVISKLFIERNDNGKDQCLYSHELIKLAAARSTTPEELISGAINDLRERGHLLRINAAGRIVNAAAAGGSFAEVFHLAQENVSIHFIAGKEQSKIPLSESCRAEIDRLNEAGEAVVLMLTKKPPEEAAVEIRDIADERFGGLMCLWQHPETREACTMSPRLEDYLNFATVRLICTSTDPELKSITADLNRHMERDGGFEDVHWARVVKGISQNEKQESLKDALFVCAPVIAVVKIVEKALPGGLHIIGGVLDDFFGAILPTVSQSMGRKGLPLIQKLKNSAAVLGGGVASLPLAFFFGWASTQIYSHFASTGAHMLAGAVFALACCAGTLGTSVAAYMKARRAVSRLEEDETLGGIFRNMKRSEKVKLAFRESVMDVPFRIGHTLIGVPFQLVFGIWAGATGFFENGTFVMVEGMAETLLGTITAFAYPPAANALHLMRLRRSRFQKDTGRDQQAVR